MSFMQAEQQSSPWIKELVQSLEWTYGALWTWKTVDESRPQTGFDANRSRVPEWKDGWYNSNVTVSLSGNDNIARERSRFEALFYSSYKSCSFHQGYGYVGHVLFKGQTTWLTGNQEILKRAVHTQALFLKTARIQTVMCMPWNNSVLELGTTSTVQESRNENVLHQIQRWLACVTNPSLITQPSPSPFGGGSEDSAGSREPMQMSPSVSSSIFADGSNVHFGGLSPDGILIKRNSLNNISHQAASFSISGQENHVNQASRVQVRKRNSLLRYPPQQQQQQHDVRQNEIGLLRHNQEVLAQRPGSMTGQHEKTVELVPTFAEEWLGGGGGSVFQQVVHDSDTVISGTSSRMAIPGMAISSLLPPDPFSQGHLRGGLHSVQQHTSLDQDLATPLPITMSPDISGLPLPMDLLQDSSDNLYGLPLSSKNSREWPSIEGNEISCKEQTQSLVQMLEEFTEEEHLQRLHTPDPVMQAVTTRSNNNISMGDWAIQSGTPISQHQEHAQQHRSQQRQRQFEFPPIHNPHVHTSIQTPTTPRPALASLMAQQNPHRQHHPHQGEQQGPRWQISFTTPTTWVRWGRKQSASLRFKGRGVDNHTGNNSGVLRVNQMILRKLLMGMVPKIAKDQKAREQEAAQAVDTETSSGRMRINSYSATTATRTESGGQDPQARTHMLAERRRRVRENEHYAALRKLIPPTSRMDKATVLAETIQLVKRLKKRVRQLEKVNPDKSGTPNLSLVTSEDSQMGTTSQSSRGDPATPPPARSSDPENGQTGGGTVTEVSPPNPKFAVPGSTPCPMSTVSHEEIKDIIEVSANECDDTQFQAKIRTPHQPQTVISILTCLKDLGLEVLATSIRIEKQWIHAEFQLKMNSDLTSNVSQFREEIQQAIMKTISPAESNVESATEGLSQSQDS